MQNQPKDQISSSTIHNSLMKLTNTVGDHDKFRNMVLSAMSAYDKLVRKLINRLASSEVKYKKLEEIYKDTTDKLRIENVETKAEYESIIVDQKSKFEGIIVDQKSEFENENSNLKSHYEAIIKNLEEKNTSANDENRVLRHHLMLMDDAVNIACADFNKTNSVVSQAVQSIIPEDYDLSNDNSTLNDELKIPLPPLTESVDTPVNDQVPAEEAIDASAMGVNVVPDDAADTEPTSFDELSVPDSINGDVIELTELGKEIEEMMANGAGYKSPSELPAQNTDTNAA